MKPTRCHHPLGITRRGFLLGAGTGLVAGGAAGLVAGGAAGWLGRGLGLANPFVARPSETAAGLAMPGPYPGRVVEVHHPGSVNEANEIQAEPVRAMMDRGLCALAGADGAPDAWRQFFGPDDVVGIKVNPVGYTRAPGKVASISSPAVLLEVVSGLKSAGVKPRNVIVFERYAAEFRGAGYEAVLRERVMDGVRWYTSSASTDSLNVQGYDTAADRADRDPHVVGYDPDVFVTMGFANPKDERARDERRHRSHVSVVVTRMVNKFITIPCLKDHRSAGVTLALKNLSHGLNNNVSRSHIANVYVGPNAGPDPESNPNQCNTFIPTAAGQRVIREKATLHILDGLVGVYEGGPGAWNSTWKTWPYRSLFFATDPVALDHVGWVIIDAKRAQEGWQPVAQMGSLQPTLLPTLASRLALLAAANPLQTVPLGVGVGPPLPGNQETEQFNWRQPEHIILAGTIGMGQFDRPDHRRIVLKG